MYKNLLFTTLLIIQAYATLPTLLASNSLTPPSYTPQKNEINDLSSAMAIPQAYDGISDKLDEFHLLDRYIDKQKEVTRSCKEYKHSFYGKNQIGGLESNVRIPLSLVEYWQNKLSIFLNDGYHIRYVLRLLLRRAIVGYRLKAYSSYETGKLVVVIVNYGIKDESGHTLYGIMFKTDLSKNDSEEVNKKFGWKLSMLMDQQKIFENYGIIERCLPISPTLGLDFSRIKRGLSLQDISKMNFSILKKERGLRSNPSERIDMDRCDFLTYCKLSLKNRLIPVFFRRGVKIDLGWALIVTLPEHSSSIGVTFSYDYKRDLYCAINLVSDLDCLYVAHAMLALPETHKYYFNRDFFQKNKSARKVDIFWKSPSCKRNNNTQQSYLKSRELPRWYDCSTRSRVRLALKRRFYPTSPQQNR